MYLAFVDENRTMKLVEIALRWGEKRENYGEGESN
jgi:hypothetical protein